MTDVVPGPYEPMSQKLASRPDFAKKGNPASIRIPFYYCDGAEGGTRPREPWRSRHRPERRGAGLSPSARSGSSSLSAQRPAPVRVPLDGNGCGIKIVCGAEGGTRTPTGFPTTPSRWRVYQVPPLRHARKNHGIRPPRENQAPEREWNILSKSLPTHYPLEETIPGDSD
jgi:hypothetical protein